MASKIKMIFLQPKVTQTFTLSINIVDSSTFVIMRHQIPYTSVQEVWCNFLEPLINACLWLSISLKPLKCEPLLFDGGNHLTRDQDCRVGDQEYPCEILAILNISIWSEKSSLISHSTKFKVQEEDMIHCILDMTIGA